MVSVVAVEEFCLIKDDVSSGDDLAFVGNPDLIYVGGIVSDEVTDMSSGIKLVPLVLLELCI